MVAYQIGIAMATHTQIGIPSNEHLIVDRTVDLVAGRASFPQREMLDRERTPLLLVTPETRLVHVLHGCGGPGFGIQAVRIMTVGAGHVPFLHGMVIREIELGFLFHVAGKTRGGISAGIDDLVALAAAGPRVQASRSMTHLAALHLDTFHRNGNAFMGGFLEFLHLFFMAGGAGRGTDILGAFHLVGFQDFFEGFDIDITAGSEETQRHEKNNSEDYFVAMKAREPFDLIHLVRLAVQSFFLKGIIGSLASRLTTAF